MQKLFFTICFFVSFSALAGVAPVGSPEELSKRTAPPDANVDKNAFLNNLDRDSLDAFFKERFATVSMSGLEGDVGKNSSGATSVVPSDEALVRINTPQKSSFQEMYEQALGRVSEQPSEEVTQQVVDYVDDSSFKAPDQSFSTIKIKLPIGEEQIDVPALSHIPYFFSNLELLNSGLILVEEDIVVLANGGTPYVRNVAQYLQTRDGQSKKIGLDILEVSINGQPIEYKRVDSFGRIYMVPKESQVLQSGVYEYKFKYVLDRQLAYYKDFDELFLDVLGQHNLVVARAGANLVLPSATQPLSQNAFVGNINNFSSQPILIEKVAPNALSFVSTIPLRPNDSFQVIASIPKNELNSIGFGKKVWWFLSDYGDVLFAFLGLLAILVAYVFSWKTMGSKSSKQKIVLKKNAPMLRYLINNSCDELSFGAFLLEMYRRNIIDIHKNDNTILLVKKTDNLSVLSSYEQKAVAALFANKESVLSVTSYNLLKFKRAFEAIKQGVKSEVRLFAYKLNSRYVAYSVAMLVFAELAMSSQYVNFYQIFGISLLLSIGLAVSLLFLTTNFSNKIANVVSKVVFGLALILNCALFAVYINVLAVLIILVGIFVMLFFGRLFMQRKGLLQNSIKESLEYKQTLLKNAPSIVLGRDFNVQQANIFALEISDKFVINNNIENVYKLDLAKEVLMTLNFRK